MKGAFIKGAQMKPQTEKQDVGSGGRQFALGSPCFWKNNFFRSFQHELKLKMHSL